MSQYCFKCKKRTEPKNYGAGEFCSECFNYFNGGPKFSNVTNESRRDPKLQEIKLREERADGEDMVRVAVRQLFLEDSFIASGMNEIQAREAARGRDGLGDAVMDVFRNARQIMKSAEDLKEAALEDHFRGMGLSEAAAKQAAKGRD